MEGRAGRAVRLVGGGFRTSLAGPRAVAGLAGAGALVGAGRGAAAVLVGGAPLGLAEVTLFFGGGAMPALAWPVVAEGVCNRVREEAFSRARTTLSVLAFPKIIEPSTNLKGTNQCRGFVGLFRSASPGTRQGRRSFRISLLLPREQSSLPCRGPSAEPQEMASVLRPGQTVPDDPLPNSKIENKRKGTTPTL